MNEEASPIPTVTTVVIGAGHAGLAMSRCLANHAIDHVVLERGEVAHTWRTERLDSLRLLTPNWQCHLPDYSFSGDDPDCYMTMSELVAFVERACGLPTVRVADLFARGMLIDFLTAIDRDADPEPWSQRLLVAITPDGAPSAKPDEVS